MHIGSEELLSAAPNSRFRAEYSWQGREIKAPSGKY
jgi:hypothetical protein